MDNISDDKIINDNATNNGSNNNTTFLNMQVITLRKENSFLAFQAQQEQQL